jgi:hypothetical protein
MGIAPERIFGEDQPKSAVGEARATTSYPLDIATGNQIFQISPKVI